VQTANTGSARTTINKQEGQTVYTRNEKTITKKEEEV
jgi:hypothetical protein